VRSDAESRVHRIGGHGLREESSQPIVRERLELRTEDVAVELELAHRLLVDLHCRCEGGTQVEIDAMVEESAQHPNAGAAQAKGIRGARRRKPDAEAADESVDALGERTEGAGSARGGGVGGAARQIVLANDGCDGRLDRLAKA